VINALAIYSGFLKDNLYFSSLKSSCQLLRNIALLLKKHVIATAASEKKPAYIISSLA
jgi:hypothetical protein